MTQTTTTHTNTPRRHPAVVRAALRSHIAVRGRVDAKASGTQRPTPCGCNRRTQENHYLDAAALLINNSIKSITYAYNTLDRLTGYADGTSTATYTYDTKQLRQTGQSVNYGSFTLAASTSYNTLGQKSSLSYPDGAQYSYTYAAKRGRVAAQQRGIHRPTPCGCNSLIEVRNASNALIAAYSYDPFGRRLSKDAGSSKTYYFGARYYDPRTSVWQSADPILGKYLDGVVGGVYESSNLAFYTYGRNNPIVLKDVDGNIVPQLIAGGVAAALDAGMQLGIMAFDNEAKFSWTDVGVSFVAGVTGVGLGNLAMKAGKFEKAASIAADSLTSAGSTVAKDSINKGELTTDGLSVGGIVLDVGLGKLGGDVGKKIEASSASGAATRNTFQREERMLSNRPDNKNAGNRPARDARAQSDVNALKNTISSRSRNAEMAGGAAASTVGTKAYDQLSKE